MIPDPEYLAAYLAKALKWEEERKAKWGMGEVKPAPPINPRKTQPRPIKPKK